MLGDNRIEELTKMRYILMERKPTKFMLMDLKIIPVILIYLACFNTNNPVIIIAEWKKTLTDKKFCFIFWES